MAVHALLPQTKRLRVFAQILERSLEDAPNLLFQFVYSFAIVGEHHPAHLDRLAEMLVHLTWSEHLSHIFATFRIARWK